MERDYSYNRGGGRSGGGSRGRDRWLGDQWPQQYHNMGGGDQRPQKYQNKGRGGGGSRGCDDSRVPQRWGPRPQRAPPPPQYQMMGGGGRGGLQRLQQYDERRSKPYRPGMIIYFISLVFICVMSCFDPGNKTLMWLSETIIGVVTQCFLSGPANEGCDQYLSNLAIMINAKLGRSNIKFLLNGQY